MLISEKTTGSIYFILFIYLFIFCVKRSVYPIVRQLEKITVKKAEAKVVKCAKNKSWVPRKHSPWSLKGEYAFGGAKNENFKLELRKKITSLLLFVWQQPELPFKSYGRKCNFANWNFLFYFLCILLFSQAAIFNFFGFKIAYLKK